MFKKKERSYFVSWWDTKNHKYGNFMARSTLTGEDLVRKMISIATMASPDAVVLSINAIP